MVGGILVGEIEVVGLQSDLCLLRQCYDLILLTHPLASRNVPNSEKPLTHLSARGFLFSVAATSLRWTGC